MVKRKIQNNLIFFYDAKYKISVKFNGVEYIIRFIIKWVKEINCQVEN